MIDVSEVLSSPDLVQQWTILRSGGGQFGPGSWIDSQTTLIASGVVTVTNPDDLMQIAEGDRVIGAMSFYSPAQMFETHVAGQEGVSDQLQWNGQNYRVSKVFPYLNYGYWKAIGVRMSGD